MCRPLTLYLRVLDAVTPQNAKFILEIGTGCNQISTQIFNEIVVKNGGQLWSVDIDPKWKKEQRFKEVIYIHSDSLKVEWDKPLDVLYIDGEHDGNHVFKELEKFAQWVKIGGKILLDDALEAGIDKAIIKFCKIHNLRWKFVAPLPCNIAMIEIDKPLT